MERRYYQSKVINQRNIIKIPAPEGMDDMCIQFSLHNITGSCLVELPSRFIDGPQDYITHRNTLVCLEDVKNLSERSWYTEFLAEDLSSMNVPEDEHPAIIQKLFHVIDQAVPGFNPISVYIWHVTLRYFENPTAADVDALDPDALIETLWLGSRCPWLGPEPEDRRMIHHIDAMESIGLYGPEPKLIPATNSFINGLEKVTFDSLESTIRQMPCAICMEGLEHFALEGTDQQQTITRLPCSHLYHDDCVVQWLESHHMCPLCRYPMPIVEVRMGAGEEEPSEASRPWNMLMMSASGVLAIATCFAFQMVERKLKIKISDCLFYVVPLVAFYSLR